MASCSGTSSSTDSLANKDFYEMLGVDRGADTAQIRKAYRRVAFKYHPDKNGGSKDATAQFQLLTKAAEVLTDPAKRKTYDRTGTADDVSEEFEDAYAFWRRKFEAITKTDIEEFEKTYKGSAEEAKDLEDAFTKFGGDMKKVMANVMLAGKSDVKRFVKHIKQQQKAKKLKKFAAFPKSCKQLRFTDESKQAAAAEAAMNGGGGLDSLRAMILAKKPAAGQGFLDGLEQKYGSKKRAPSGGRAKKSQEQISEDEFQALQSQMLQGNKGTSGKQGTKRTARRKAKGKKRVKT